MKLYIATVIVAVKIIVIVLLMEPKLSKEFSIEKPISGKRTPMNPYTNTACIVGPQIDIKATKKMEYRLDFFANKKRRPIKKPKAAREPTLKSMLETGSLLRIGENIRSPAETYVAEAFHILAKPNNVPTRVDDTGPIMQPASITGI